MNDAIATANRTPAEAAYVDGFEPVGPLAELRREAVRRFAAQGLPHRRLEDWRWTDLRQIIARAYPPASAATAAPAARVDALVALSPFAGIVRARLVFVDGRFDAARSRLPQAGDVEVATLAGDAAPDRLADPAPVASTDPIAALNLAHASDGAVLRFGPGATADVPVELLFVHTGTEPVTYTTRNLVVVGDGASASLIETHIGGDGAYVANSVSELRLGAGARLDRIKVQEEGPEAVHLANTEARLGADAVLRDFTLTVGGRATRQQGFVTFAGGGGDARIDGGYLLADRQHCDTRLVVDHAVPGCTSRELFKCVIDEAARGVFQGKVIVRPDAQKTDGKQSSHALLLSDTAEFDAKPELEIYADDVVCGHGATAGDLDAGQLFYLRSRGIPEAEAKSMLIAAFAAEAFDAVDNEAVRAVLADIAVGWLHRRAG